MKSIKKKFILITSGIIGVIILFFVQKLIFKKASKETVCNTEFSRAGSNTFLVWKTESTYEDKSIRLMDDKIKPDLHGIWRVPLEAFANLRYFNLPGYPTELGVMKSPNNRFQEFTVFRDKDKCALISFAKEYKAPWAVGRQKFRAPQGTPQCTSDNAFQIFKGGDGNFYMYDTWEAIQHTGTTYGECKEGKKNGVWKSRHPVPEDSERDRPFLTSHFDNGKRVGKWSVQSPNGEVVYTVDMDDNPNGGLIICDEILGAKVSSQIEACHSILALRNYPDDGGNLEMIIKWKDR